MALTVSGVVTDVDTPANLVTFTNEAGNDISVDVGGTSRKVAGADVKTALYEVSQSSSTYARILQVYDVDTPTNFLQIEPGASTGLIVTAGATSRECLYTELLNAAENALNG